MFAYDQLHYPGMAYRFTRPDRTALIARLFGLKPAPAPPARARVLELGCGTGANLLPMAQAFPAARFVGVDLSRSQIELGRELAAAAGLGNVELRHLDLADVDAGFGAFDYIIAHGVYSWVPVPVRARLVAVCAERLAPAGIALISHNVTPGYWPKALVGEMLRWHVRELVEPAARIAEARAFLARLTAEATNDLYREVLAEQGQRLARIGDAALYHDDLADVCDGGPVLELAAALEAHGLQFLADADLQSSIPTGFAPGILGAVADVAHDLLEREQVLDYLKNRKFRVTLACRAGVAVERRLAPAQLRDLCLACGAEPTGRPDLRSAAPVTFTHEGSSITVEQPLLKAALVVLRDVWPRAMPFAELAGTLAALGRAPDVNALAAGLLGAFVARIVELSLGEPAFVTTPSARPRTTPLVRVLAARGLPVANLRHAHVTLDDRERAVLAQLDGSRDRAALGAGAEPVLSRLARLALLVA